MTITAVILLSALAQSQQMRMPATLPEPSEIESSIAYYDVASLLTFRNGAVAEYLAAYVQFREPSLTRRAELLPTILASGSVPSGHLENLAMVTATCFDHASTVGQDAMIRQFAEVALSNDSLRAKTGFHALSHLVMNDRELVTHVPQRKQTELAGAYFDLLRREKMQPDKFLEPLFRAGAK